MNNSLGGNLSGGANGAQTEILRRAGEAVLRGESHFREVLDALPAAVYVTDATGLITYYNPAAAASFGVSEPARSVKATGAARGNSSGRMEPRCLTIAARWRWR